MQKRQFGETGCAIPVIGQGTWKILDNEAVVATLRRGIDLGMTHVDTAELYTGAEEVVGRAIADVRESVYLVSKVVPDNASRRGTIMACERSLRKLQTDYLDCYLLHWPSHLPIQETMDAMRELYDAGKIRAVGVSNFDVMEMEEAKAALGPVPLACNQVIYHMGNRAIEHDVVPWCEDNNVAVVGYSPFAYEPSLYPGSPEYEVLAEIARRHERTVRQVILRFLTRSDVLFAIPKASTVPHVEENALANGFELTTEDLGDIEMAFPV